MAKSLFVLLIWMVTVPARAESLPPLVFIHGIKGSRLVDDSGHAHWISVLEAAGLKTPSLALPRRFEQGKQAAGEFTVGGLLEKVVVIPWLLEVDVYGSWIKAATKLGRDFYPYAYDWRRDNGENAANFAAFLRDLRAKTGRPVQVVAHSMGGLITLATLIKQPDLFQSVVFAGVPFAGGIGFLPDLHAGRATGLNGDILSPEVLATMPSVFSLFPLGDTQALVDREGHAVPVDFFNLDSWCRLKLGPCAAGELSGDDRDFFTETLGRARAFRASLYQVPGGPLAPVMVVASKSRSTLVRAVQGGPKSERGWDFESADMHPGDGRVAFEHALPPAAIPFKVMETEEEHALLLRDPKVVAAIQELAAAK